MYQTEYIVINLPRLLDYQLLSSYAFCITAITCEDLLNPPNGDVNFSPDKTAPFDFGTNATYSCGTGFGLSEGNAMRTCDGDGSSPIGEWDGTAPTCEGIKQN